MSAYGYCPTCNKPGVYRERRPGGDDRCEAGHTYPSREARLAPGATSLMTEGKVVERLDAWRKEGAKSRVDLTPNPYPANSLQYYMHMCGWVAKDLELALRKADPNGYGKNPALPT